MKKFLILTILFALSGCQIPEQELGGVDSSSLSVLYDQSAEIKSKYQLSGAALERTIKSDPKDTIKAVVGNKAPEGLLGADETFTPDLTLSRWDEVSVKIKPDISKVATKGRKLSFENDKIVFDTPDKKYRMYELTSEEYPEGAYEYDIVLKSKPSTNVVSVGIETQGLDFFYQPPLDVEMASSTCTPTDCGESHRPENVVGSYAAYHKTKGGLNDIKGKDYKVGKAFHIYRPKVIDANGKEVWGELNVDVEKGIMTVTIPQKFLDEAAYPVVVDPTFGYTSAGGSSSSSSTNRSRATSGTPGSSGTVTSISALFSYNVGACGHRGILLNTDADIVTNGTGAKVEWFGTSGEGWKESTFSTGPSVTASTAYFVGTVESELEIGIMSLKWDSGAPAGNGKGESDNNYDAPTNYSSESDFSNYYSIYATYSEGGGESSATTTDSSDVMFFD